MLMTNLQALPNFASIENDICLSLKDCKYPAPPNSVIQSCASAVSLVSYYDCTPINNCCFSVECPSPSAGGGDPDDAVISFCRRRTGASTAAAGEENFRSGGRDRQEDSSSFNIKTRSPLPRKCAPGPCQIPLGPLTFITREISDPLWNSTYCLERIKTIISSSSLSGLDQRVDEIWKLYVKKSPQGVFLRDVHEMSKIIRYIDLEFCRIRNGEKLLAQVFSHLKKGIKIKVLSEQVTGENLRLTLDGFSRALTFGKPQVRSGILQTLIAWVDYYTEDPKRVIKFEPKCEQRVSFSSKTRCNTSQGCRSSEEIRAGAPRIRNTDPEVETKCIASCKISRPKQQLDQFGTLSKTTFFGAFESSILPSTLEQLCTSKDFGEEYIQVLVIIRKLCENSYCIRSCVVNSSVLDAILLKLGYPDENQTILRRTTELLYSLLSLNSEDYNGFRIYAVPSSEAFESLLYRFMNMMLCAGHSNNSVRNDVAFVIYLLPLYCPPLRKVFSHHIRDFASILANNILTNQNFDILLDSTPADLELMQYLIWITSLIIPANPDCYSVIESYQLIPVMMRLIIGPCALMEEAGLNSTAVEAVINAATHALMAFAQVQPFLFLQPEGILPMLKTLSLFASNGQLSLVILEAFLDVIRVLLSHESSPCSDMTELHKYFAMRNGMEIFCAVLRILTSYDNFVISIESILCKVLYCCSQLGKYDESQKDEFANKKGVKTIIRLFHQLLYTQAQLRHMSPTLQLMVVDCIWNCIADCPTGLEIFLLYEGMFRLLDLLEIAASPIVRLHIFGALLELCDYSRCTDQLLFWHRRLRKWTARNAHTFDFKLPPDYHHCSSKPVPLGDEIGNVVGDLDQSLAALLCEIWLEEEIRLKVLRDKDGAISSLRYPLLSEYARNYNRKVTFKHPLPGTSPGSAVLDMLMAARPRIFLLVRAITEQTNTEATVFSGLGLKNQLTMQVIANYLDLKVSEIWADLSEEFEAEGLTLVSSDVRASNILLKIYQNKVAAVMNTQKYLLQRGTEQAAMNERELYTLLRNCQLQDHLMALREAQYYATLSDYFLLVDKRLVQQTEINDLYLNNEDANVVKQKPKRTKQSKPTSQEEDALERKSLEELGQFGISMNINHDMHDMIPATPPGCHDRHPSELRSGSSSILSAEENKYMVSPVVLYKALTKFMAQQKQWKEKNVNEEREWLMRKKWNPNWYSKAN